MRLVLGLDIGIASVGYGIIDIETGDIITSGVRLFTEADKKNNEGRRSFRSGRRLLRRRKLRKEELKELLKDNGVYEWDSSLDPYICRVKGLNEKLSNAELTTSLLHICKHRGSSLETVEDENNKEDGLKNVLTENDNLIKQGKYVCEIQLERKEKKGKIRGINNNFRTKDYDSELLKILSNQGLDENINKKIEDIITRRRHFSVGPGSFISQTIYGQVYNEDGTVRENMIEKMTGKCSVYPDQLRSPKSAPSAIFFNLLNDLNNLRVADEPIDVDKKQELIKEAFEKKSLTPLKVAKVLGVNLDDIEGFRKNEKSLPILTDLADFKIMVNIFEKNGYIIKVEDLELLDEIAVIITKTKVKKERIDEIKIKGVVNEKILDELSDITRFTGYHSLSLKAIRELNKELYETTYNQMEILSLSNHFEFIHSNFSQKGKKKIAINQDAILSPVAMRSYCQAIKVVNAARKKYGEFEAIVVETTRDKNSYEEKKRIKEENDFFAELNKNAEELVKGYNVKLDGKLRTKLRLYLEQDCKTGYLQEPIDLPLLIKDPTAYEIDHIIPISISLDDSYNNKTLVTRYENQKKGNNTPIKAYESDNFLNKDVNEYKKFIASIRNKQSGISWKKYNNYMYSKDITKYEVMKEFIARNLVDTSYANRLVFNTLTRYFKDNGINTKVHTIRGSVTSAFRKLVKGLEKDRDKDYSHHAIDALIVASVKKMNLFDKLLTDFSIADDGKNVIINKDTGEISKIDDDLYFKDAPFLKFLKSLLRYKVTDYSYQIDTKPNRSIADQTIYSTRNVDGKDYTVKKIKNIYDPKATTLADDIVNGVTGKYLMEKNDSQTYQKIVDIVNYYAKEYRGSDKLKDDKGKKKFVTNPLKEHLDETGEYITKYSVNNKGPVITSMRYFDGELGSHIDISQNYKNIGDKKVVLLQISPYRTDFYKDEGIYKFVTVRYSNIKYYKKDDSFVINEQWYLQEKRKKAISENAEFCFSMHHNEYIEIKSSDECNLYRFTATNNDKANTIEVKEIDRYEKKQNIKTIGKKIVELKKYSCDSLGQLREVKNARLKLRLK